MADLDHEVRTMTSPSPDPRRSAESANANDDQSADPNDGQNREIGDSSQRDQVHEGEIGRASQTNQADDKSSIRPFPETYFSQYRWMREHMPHWKNTFSQSRGSKSTITVFDATSLEQLQLWQDPGSRKHPIIDGEARPELARVPSLDLSRDRSHVIFTEDISPDLINTLGQALDIGPDVFEEHLHRSGYRGPESYRDADPRTWWTRHQGNEGTQHATLRWFSVVDRLPVELISANSRERATKETLKWSELVQSDEGAVNVHHILNVRTNVFRQAWELRAASASATIPTIVAWEEQVTCFRKRRPAGTTAEQIIFFLDPLPKMLHRWSRGGSSLGDRRAKIHSSEELLFRRATKRLPPMLSHIDHTQDRDRFKKYADQTQSTLTDISDWIRFLQARNKSARSRRPLKKGKHAEGEEEVKAANSEYEGQGDKGARQAEPSGLETAIPISALLHVIRIDTMFLLRHLSVILDTIPTDAMSERLMQERLSSWRSLLNWAQRELPQLSDSLAEFFSFATATPDSIPIVLPGLHEYSPVVVDPRVVQLQEHIKDIVDRCDRTQEHLRAEMSLLESKRGIAEAENVTRLTELAFIFIPMSFAAALFSMQIQELDDARPRAWMFVVTALGFVVLAYMLRLVLRSPTLNLKVQELGRRIRTDRQIPDGLTISAHKAVGWVWGYVQGNMISVFLVPWLALYAALVAVLLVFVGDLRLRITIVVLLTVLMGPVMFAVWWWIIRDNSLLPDFSRFYPQPRDDEEGGETTSE